MLKKRIIPILLWERGRLVKTRNFCDPRIVGDPVKTARVYSDQDADEICLLNISDSTESSEGFLHSVRLIANETLAPLTVGGGIREVSDAEIVFRAGADKVVINSLSYRNPGLVEKMVQVFGSQAIVAGVDYRQVESQVRLFSENGERPESVSLSSHLKNLEKIGVGEILLQSIDRDGFGRGYDLDTLDFTLENSRTPVICAGGAGNYGHLLEAFQLGVDAVACGTLFNFGDNNPIRAKAFLRNYSIPLKKSL